MFFWCAFQLLQRIPFLNVKNKVSFPHSLSHTGHVEKAREEKERGRRRGVMSEMNER